MHPCKNCLKETVFVDGYCPECITTSDSCCTCGAQSTTREPDGLGNEYIVWPCNCRYEIIMQDLECEPQDDTQTEQPPETFGEDDTVYNLPGSARTKQFLIACWNCKEEKIDPNKAIKDQVKIFGYICPDCSCSIREDRNLLMSIAKRLGMRPEERRIKYLKEIVDDLKKLPK